MPKPVEQENGRIWKPVNSSEQAISGDIFQQTGRFFSPWKQNNYFMETSFWVSRFKHTCIEQVSACRISYRKHCLVVM
jgi:hypothetical protein